MPVAVTMQQKADSLSKNIQTLNTQIFQTLAAKKDVTLAGAAQKEALVPIRSNVKCRRTLKGHFGKITALDWSGDGNTVVSASQDGNLLLWDAVSTSKKQTVRLKSSYVMSVCMEEGGRFVAAGGLDNACSIYSVGGEAPARLVTELVSHEGYLADCVFFRSPSKMLTASADATSLLWDVERGQIIDTFAEHKSNLTNIRLFGENTFLSSSTDKSIKLWDVRTGAKGGSLQTLTGHAGDVNGITVLPGGSANTLASCSEDGTVRVWDLRAYGEVSSFGQIAQPDDRDPFSDGDAGFTSIAASNSGRLLFCGHSEGSVVCYDVLGATKDPAYVLNNVHEEHISCVGVSPTGEALCTGSWDFNLKIFA